MAATSDFALNLEENPEPCNYDSVAASIPNLLPVGPMKQTTDVVSMSDESSAENI